MILSSTLINSSIIIVSRATGYVRDFYTASLLGAGIASDAFIVASKFANMLRSIFAEGAFSNALTPLIHRFREKRGIEQAQNVASYYQFALFAILSLFIGVSFTFMSACISIVTPGLLLHKSETLHLATQIGYIVTPYILFIALAAFYGTMLTLRNMIWPYTATSILCNIVIVAFIHVSLPIQPVFQLALGMLLGGICELLWMIFWLHRARLRIPFRPIFYIRLLLLPFKSRAPDRGYIDHRNIDKNIECDAQDHDSPNRANYLRFIRYTKILLGRMYPGMISSGVMQINIWIDMALLSFSASAAISYLYYADRIVQLPLAIIGTASAIVLLPVLSSVIARGDVSRTQYLFNRSISITCMLSIPSCIGLTYIAPHLVQVLFEHGEFTKMCTTKTSEVIKYLSFAMPFYIAQKVYIAVAVAHSQKRNIYLPLRAAKVSLCANAGVSLALYFWFDYLSVAIGAIFSAIAGLIVLALGVHQDLKIRILPRTLKIILFSICGSLIMMIFYKVYFETLITYIDKINKNIIDKMSSNGLSIFHLMLEILFSVVIYFSAIGILLLLSRIYYLLASKKMYEK